MKKLFIILPVILLVYFLNPVGGRMFYVLDIRWAYVMVVAFLFSVVFTPYAIFIGNKCSILDYPNERKIHNTPVPITGGIAVFASFFFALVRNMNFNQEMKGVLFGAMVLFVAGIIDDTYKLSAKIKLLIQIIAAGILVYYGVKVSIIPHGFPIKAALDVFISMFGIIGIINAFNYMDGMNGEASGLAIIAGLVLFFIAAESGDRHVQWLSMALVGSSAGFLLFNFPNAKIFLGDSGSTLIGYLLSAIAISASWNTKTTSIAIVTPLLIFSILIFDMIYTTMSRIKNGTVRSIGQWLSVTGKDHLHHRLVFLGLTKVQAVLVVWIIAVVFSFSAFIIRNSSMTNAILIFVQSIFIYMLIVVLMLVGREKGVSDEH